MGGFFHLFDWNGKSRKKLFSNTSELPEISKQEKRNLEKLPRTRFNLNEEDEIMGMSTIKGCSDCSCNSSVTDEEGSGVTRAPNAVARLMGLESMPVTVNGEPNLSPYIDFHRHQNGYYHHRHPKFTDFYSDSQHALFTGQSNETVLVRPSHSYNRPIERFQTEVLPPKSAKPIPVTHNKLLSPIKNPRFYPSKDAAHIMEQAAKILQPGIQSSERRKFQTNDSFSVPNKVHNLSSQILEASKNVESNAAKFLRDQSLNRKWNDSEATPSFKIFRDAKESDDTVLGAKKKSISLAIQAKVNVQRRESLNLNKKNLLIQKDDLVQRKEDNNVHRKRENLSSNGKGLISQRHHSDPKLCQSNNKKSRPASSLSSSSGVLRQNNRKQNCTVIKENPLSKSLIVDQQRRKSTLNDTGNRIDKMSLNNSRSSKVRTRKQVNEKLDNLKEVQSITTKNLTRKRRSADGAFLCDKTGYSDEVSTENSGKSDTPIDEHPKLIEVDKGKKEMDVVSFTFTSPMAKSTEIMEKNAKKGCFINSHDERTLNDTKSKKPSLGRNVIGGDSLSVLLEQKLRELASVAESSTSDSVKAITDTNPSSILKDLITALNNASARPRVFDKRIPSAETNEAQTFKGNQEHNIQEMESIEYCKTSDRQVADMMDFQYTSPVSNLDFSFSTESCNSSDSHRGFNNGNLLCPSFHVPNYSSTPTPNKSCLENEIELSDSASSYCNVKNPELEYVKEVIHSSGFVFKDLELNQFKDIVNPVVFHRLEKRKGEKWGINLSMRKAIFDSVNECMDLKCRKYARGGYKSWEKGVRRIRTDRLVEEVYKEINGWERMADWMVDELVEKDMDLMDLESENWEIESVIEGEILSSLLHELVIDIIKR